MGEERKELPQDRWFWVWLSIFSILLGTSPFVDWDTHFWRGVLCSIGGLAGLLVLVRDRLRASIKKLPLLMVLKVFAVAVLSTVVGQLIGYDLYVRRHPELVRLWPWLAPLLGIGILGIAWGLWSRNRLSYLVEDRESVDVVLKGLPKQPSTPPLPKSKLVIHRAVYAAGLATEVSVTNLLQDAVREGLTITVDPTLRGLLPTDPASGVRKRLDLEYSYGSETRFSVSRLERPSGEPPMRLVLPEDTEIARLERELSHWQAKCSAEKATDLSEKAKAENKVLELAREVLGLERKIEELKSSLPKPSQYPIPELRLKVISMVSELQGFLGTHGQEPEVTKQLQEENADYLKRYRAIVTPWRARVLGDYRLKFSDSIPRLRDEIRVRTGKDDFVLNNFIQTAANNPNGNIKAVEGIVKALWDMAPEINV